MQSFGELLTEYMRRTGISDSELARSIGVQRQTIFRWKEGTVGRPRVREDVLHCATRLRLSPEERDLLLLAGGFSPESSTSIQSLVNQAAEASVAPISSLAQADEPLPKPAFTTVDSSTVAETLPVTPASELANKPALAIPSWMPQWIYGGIRWGWGIAVFALLALIGIQLPRWMGINNPILTPTPVPITIEAPPTVPAEPTPIPTPTIKPAQSSELLILIAQFHNYAKDENYNMAGRLEEELSREVRSNGLRNIRTIILGDEILSGATATYLITQTKAALVIWGEYDSGRVLIRYADRDSQNQVQQTLKPPDQLSALINNSTPKEVKALALVTLGQIYRRSGDVEKAKQVLDLALAQNPEAQDIRARTLFYLARIQEDQANQQRSVALFSQAIELYSQLIDLNPQPEKSWVNIWYNRANAYSKRAGLAAKATPELSADLDAAIADYNRALQLKPDYKFALLNRGVAYYERNGDEDITLAIADFEQAIQLDTTYRKAHFMYGLGLLRNNLQSDWEASFLKVKTLPPNDLDVNIALCWGYVLANQLEKAQTECDQVRTLSNDAAEHADLQALLLAQKGDLQQAAAQAKRHLEWLKTEPAQLYERLNGPLVEQWIAKLEADENPFDAAMLDQLRRGK